MEVIMKTKPEVLRETSRGIETVNTVSELFARKRTLFITGKIDDEAAEDMITSLLYLESQDSKEPVKVIINSPGGEVRSGLAIYDALRLMSVPVITVCTGSAASMGAVIFAAGDKRIMLPHSEIMIHDPSYGSLNVDHMKPHEIQERVDSLKKTGDELVKILTERTGRTEEDVREKTREDSFFAPEEAIRFGLATDTAKSLKEVIS